MAAKKNVAVTPAFTGRNVSLSEISQASGIGVATLKKGLISGAVDFGYAIPCGKGDQHRYYCPDRLVYLKTEELAAMIKQESRRDLLPLLWERVRKLLFMKSSSVYARKQKAFFQCGVDLDDLKQESYFVFLQALDGYKPDSGETFNAYLKYPFLRMVNTLLGTVNGRENAKPLDNAVSLNTTTTNADGDAGAELIELVSDPDTVPHNEQITRREQKKIIRAAVMRLDEPYREIIQRSYYQNEPLSIIAKSLDMNFGQCSRARNAALLILRNTAEVKALAMYDALDELDGVFKTNPAFFLPYWNIFTASEKYVQAAAKARSAQSYGQRQAIIYEAYQKYRTTEERAKHG